MNTSAPKDIQTLLADHLKYADQKKLSKDQLLQIQEQQESYFYKNCLQREIVSKTDDIKNAARSGRAAGFAVGYIAGILMALIFVWAVL